MTIHLSALGWVDEAPRGNRLRWHYPAQEVRDRRYLGLPETLVVERAPLDQQDLFATPESSSSYPYLWWEAQGDVPVAGLFLPFEHVLASPVQAVTFVYHGPPGRIVVRDRKSGRMALDRAVADGDVLYAEAVSLDSILAFAVWGTLKDLRTLDLFQDRGLHFSPIAEVAVDASYGVDLEVIGRRYDQAPTLSAAEWAELRQIAADAKASEPATRPPGVPSAWDNLAIMLGLRWEFALLGGFAFFDGPRKEQCELDQLSDVLKEPASGMLAYRVVNRDASGERSNLVVCAPWVASPLSTPTPPWYVKPEVRLRERKTTAIPAVTLAGHASLRDFSPVTLPTDNFGCRLTMGWQQNDPRALGVEIEEAVSGSPATGAAARSTFFMSRSRRVDQPPLQGSVARSFDVAFPDVTLQARARALDAWDRLSAFSGWSAPSGLTLVHEPSAPPLESANYQAGTVRIARVLGRPELVDWQPNALVERAAGQVFVYRRHVPPQVANVTVGTPLIVTPGRYRATVSGVSSLADFVGGSLSVGSFTESVVAASASTVDFVVPDNGGAIPLFTGGPARLSQCPTYPALWTHIASFPATALPAELVFGDPLPPSAVLAVESYAARLSYLGRLGPMGNIVCAIRDPAVPAVPPPFTVQVLGSDFFHRVMIKLRFTGTPAAGRFTIWWAPGNVAPVDFVQRGGVATYGEQDAEGGLVLYDMIPVRLPLHVDSTVTVGVQRVAEGGTQSDFVIVPVLLPALLP